MIREIRIMQPRAKESDRSQKPEETRTRFLPWGLQRMHHPDNTLISTNDTAFGPLAFKTLRKINLYWYKTSSLWYFVIAAIKK